MNCRLWFIRCLTLAALMTAASGLQAGRTPSLRTPSMRSNGVRADITVPYLTTGRSTIMPGAVAPRIYNSPNVDDPSKPGVVPVFNLIFYGSREGFGDLSNGAKPRIP